MTSTIKLLLAMLAVVGPTAMLVRADLSLRDEIRGEVAELRQQLGELKAMQPLAADASAQRGAAEAAQLQSQRSVIRGPLAGLPASRLASPIASLQPESAPQQELSVRLEQHVQNAPETLEGRRLANEVGASIQRALPLGAGLRLLHCASSLCRAEISYGSAEQLQNFIETHLDGGESGFWQGPVYLQLLADPSVAAGEVRLLLYLARSSADFDLGRDGGA